ncbi:hypothetical protein CASFOL_030154 [Castilleja foliolosa]|uniref:Uncharacterized protein n=1 Tax=Castilleja foliolosa TaxID=1961234 RepID=A0ABD3CCR9_9LAMI
MVTGSGDGVWGSRWLADGRSGGSRACAAEVSRLSEVVSSRWWSLEAVAVSGLRAKKRKVTDDEFAEYMAKKAQKRAMKTAKHARSQSVRGYWNDSTPFGDSNLYEKFVWRKKIEKDVIQGVLLDEFSVKAEKKMQKERMAEIEKVKKRIEERAIQKAQHEEEMRARPSGVPRLGEERGRVRGLSSCYAGKSKSFGNLTDFPLDDSKDLTTKEHHVNKKRRLLLAHKTFYGTRTGSSSSPNVGPTSLLSDDQTNEEVAEDMDEKQGEDQNQDGDDN